jgi:hypothetical protein
MRLVTSGATKWYTDMNFPELIEELKREEETILLELLEISSEELVDAFLDKIKENEDKCHRHFL